MSMFLTLFLGLLALGCLVSSKQIPLPKFHCPPKTYGAKFRYWFPDSSIAGAELVKDIESIDAVGAKGLEFVPYYNYGVRDPSFPPWDEFGFGSAKFRDLFTTALKASHEAGLVFDFSLGANQGQGVPAKPLTPGLAMQLLYGEATVSAGESFDGEIPEANPFYNFGLSELADFMHHHENWGPKKLLAVVAGGVKSSTPAPDSNLPEYEFIDVVLDEASLVDLTEEVDGGKLKWTAPTDHANYTIFAVYESYSNQRSLDATENAVDLIGNGSWITDHFSAVGAELVIKFWEDNLLDGDTKELLKAVGEHSWEDSLEMSSALWWSHDFMDRFETNRGYNPAKYLPLMFHQSNSLRAAYRPYNKTYVLDTANSGQSSYLQDYRLTLNDGYQEYLAKIEQWSQSLGLSYSAQVAYNLPLDMAASVPFVGGPELESLAFPSIDHYSQFVGAAHLSGRRVISSELGAVFTGAYSLSVKELLLMFQDSFAAGVNAMVVHGMSYGGEFNSTWPGYTPLTYGFGEAWGRRRPDWLHMNESMAYTSRNQLVLQTGAAKRDLAFYRYDEPWSMSVGYESDDLRAAGYSYEYLGAANIASEEAVLSEGVLAPKGPSYRALVFNNQDYITPDAAIKVLEFAQQGFPIVVLGSLPNTTIGTAGQDHVSKTMDYVAMWPDNVKIMAESESLPDFLANLGVKPRVSVQSKHSANLYSLWRSTDSADFVFLYNKGEEGGTFKLTFDVSDNKVPYKLDAWTGEQSEILVFERSDDGLSLSVSLSAGQTAIFAFVPCPSAAKPHFTSHSSNIERVERGNHDGFVAYVKDEKNATLAVSHGTDVTIDGSKCDPACSPIELDSWNLTIQSWVPDSSDSSSSRSVVETIDLGIQSKLVPWSNITAARNVSGVGIYTTTFSLPKSSSDSSSRKTAVMIHFGPVLNTLRAWINDQLLPPVDNADAELDISEFLSPGGNNTIRVETSSSLFNAVKARADSLNTLGQPPMNMGVYEDADFMPFGLVGPVTLRPLRKVTVNLH